MRIKSDFTENPREEKEDQLPAETEKLKNGFRQDFQAAPEEYNSLQIVHIGESTEDISSPGKDRLHGKSEAQGGFGAAS